VAFTYDDTLSTDLARCRFHGSDKDAAKPRFSDAEIGALITARGTWQGAVADMWTHYAGNIAKYGREYSASRTDGTSETVSEAQFHAHCLAQAKLWEDRAAATTATQATLPRATVRALGRPPQDPYQTFNPTGTST
jgi:hypothetical protein